MKQSVFSKFKRFLEETVLEVKRSTWTDRRTLVLHTIIVIVGVFALGLFVGVSDRLVASFLRLLVPHS